MTMSRGTELLQVIAEVAALEVRAQFGGDLAPDPDVLESDRLRLAARLDALLSQG